VDKAIDINASAERVWDVLTAHQYTVDWASEFSSGSPAVHIESDWDLGSAVLWKDDRGQVIVEGSVTALELHSLLRFTVFEVKSRQPPVLPDDGITFKLTERGGTTRLWVSQGDFSAMADGEKYRDLSVEIWDRALARIRWLAEHPRFSS
jgi:uncharacterized protein YndB with AHSA1/START domain